MIERGRKASVESNIMHKDQQIVCLSLSLAESRWLIHADKPGRIKNKIRLKQIPPLPFGTLFKEVFSKHCLKAIIKKAYMYK